VILLSSEEVEINDKKTNEAKTTPTILPESYMIASSQQ
jgi:hypothetical protein